LRLVASDRYRLAVSTVLARDQNGPAIQVIAPRSLIDGCALARDEEISIRLEPHAVQVDNTQSAAIDAVFPDYQRPLRTTPARQITITTADLRHRLTMGPTRTLTQAPNEVAHEVSVVLLTDDTLDVIERDHPDAAGFNREFLLEAIEAGRADQLVLALDGPITPLAIRDPDRPDDISLLMPTRLT
ncbi:MAG: hypothetical protein ACRDQ1_15020, partial [Sciscionella sp.]